MAPGKPTPALTWTLCGAGRGVGKTHLARRLAELLPRSVYVKHGHGTPRAGRCPAFFHRPEEAREFALAAARTHRHVIVESNALAREGFGDIIVFVDAPPGRADVRPDVETLRAAANVVVSAGADSAGWQRVLAGRLSPRLRRAVAEALADQAAFLARCRVTPAVKLWFEAGGEHVFGAGLAGLLEQVAERGSLREAARAGRISYRYAWERLRRAERHLGRRLVRRRPGGRGGGGSTLTEDGRRLLAAFRALEADLGDYAARRLVEWFEKDGPDDG